MTADKIVTHHERRSEKPGSGSKETVVIVNDGLAPSEISTLSKRPYKLWATCAFFCALSIVSLSLLGSQISHDKRVDQKGPDATAVAAEGQGRLLARSEHQAAGAFRPHLPPPRNVQGMFPEVDELFRGNQNWTQFIHSEQPGLLPDQAANGQKPKFMYIGCSDSRVSESLITSALPGELFVERNIANQYLPGDLNSQTVLSYAVEHLGVSHVLIVGHIGCGGIQGAMAAPEEFENRDPLGNDRLDTWLAPVRRILLTSERPELVEHRTRFNGQVVPPPENGDPAFIALVEENVKNNVINVAQDPVIQESWRLFTEQNAAKRRLRSRAVGYVRHLLKRSTLTKRDGHEAAAAPADHAAVPPPAEHVAPPVPVPSEHVAPVTHVAEPEAEEHAAPVAVWVHGYVYDIRDGKLHDLGVSLGPEH